MFWGFESSENLEYLKLPKETRFKREKYKKKKKVCVLKHYSIKKQNNEQMWVPIIFALLEQWWKNNEISIMGENEAGAFTEIVRTLNLDTVS